MPGKQVTELDALPSFTDTSLLPVHNGAGLKKGKLSQLANYLGTKFSNPNLLINPDFKINQRGNSTYSSTNSKKIYTVDRWNIYNANLNASTKGVSEVGVLISSEASLQIDYVKLEEGAVATAYTAPSAIEEYPKCQRYFQYIPKLYCVPLVYTRDLISVSEKFFQATSGNLPTEMRITPTLTYKALGQSDNSTFTGSASFELTSKSIDTITLDRAISNFTITINGITLDAEIY